MQKITFLSDRYHLIGNLFLPKKKKRSGLLIIHGASNIGKIRNLSLQQYLYKFGFASFAFDTRGVGESEGNFADATLANRLTDSINAYNEFKKYVDTVIVFGASMGGYVALQLTHIKKDIPALILLGAAAYDPKAEQVQLGPLFTAIISKERSWDTSQSFTDLKNFSGKTLLIYGENDVVIPQEIQQRYQSLLKPTDASVQLKGSGHNFLAGKTEHEEKALPEGLKIIGNFLLTLQT